MPVIGTELERNRVANPRGRTADTAPILVRRNLAANPSLEVDAAGYAAIAGTGGVNTVVRSPISPYIGSFSARTAWTTGTTAVGGGVQYNGSGGGGTPVAPNTSYAFSWYVLANKNQRLQMQVEWRTAANALISTSTALSFLFQFSGGSTRAQLVAVSPATAAYAIVRIVAAAGTGAVNWAAGDALTVDALLIEQETKVLEFFDLIYRTYGATSALGDGSIGLYDQYVTIRTNLAVSPSSETADAASYAASVGTAGCSIAPDTTRALYGGRSLKLARLGTSGTAGATWLVAAGGYAAGDRLTYSAYIWVTTARTIRSYAEVTLIDRTSDGYAAGGTGSPGSGTTLTVNPGQWTRVSFTITIPTTLSTSGAIPAIRAAVGLAIADTLPDPIWVDGVLIERGTETGGYFDGSSPSDGFETHAWSTDPYTQAVQSGYSASRRVSAHPTGAAAVGGALYWQYATGGVGVKGSELNPSAAGTGVALSSVSLAVGSYTAIATVLAVDAVTISAFGQAGVAIAAGVTREFRQQVTQGTAGAYIANITQTDAAAKRWVVTGYAVITQANYIGPYFDGSMTAPDPDTRYTWVGVPDNSETVHELLPTPELTATVDPVNKGVQLLAEGVAQVDRITIQRVVAGYPIGQPRGARDAPTIGGTLLVFDNEAPLGVPVSYQVRGRFTDGTTSPWSTQITVTIPIEPNEVWLKDLGQPLRSLRVTLRNLGGKNRKARSETHDVQDSEHPVVVSGIRQAASEEVTFGTTTDAARTKMEALLATGQVLLLQCPPGWGRPDAYITVGDSRELRVVQYGPRPERDWQVTIQEVAEPSVDRTGLPTSSYRQVSEDFASYRALMANRQSYLGVLANSSDIQ